MNVTRTVFASVAFSLVTGAALAESPKVPRPDGNFRRTEVLQAAGVKGATATVTGIKPQNAPKSARINLVKVTSGPEKGLVTVVKAPLDKSKPVAKSTVNELQAMRSVAALPASLSGRSPLIKSIQLQAVQTPDTTGLWYTGVDARGAVYTLRPVGSFHKPVLEGRTGQGYWVKFQGERSQEAGQTFTGRVFRDIVFPDRFGQNFQTFSLRPDASKGSNDLKLDSVPVPAPTLPR